MCSAPNDEKPGCTLCILAFSSFSYLPKFRYLNFISAHLGSPYDIVHPSFFILQLTDFSTFSELKDENSQDAQCASWVASPRFFPTGWKCCLAGWSFSFFLAGWSLFLAGWSLFLAGGSLLLDGWDLFLAGWSVFLAGWSLFPAGCSCKV